MGGGLLNPSVGGGFPPARLIGCSQERPPAETLGRQLFA